VVVSNTAGTITSSAATLTVTAASGGADDHGTTSESDGDFRADRELHGTAAGTRR